MIKTGKEEKHSTGERGDFHVGVLAITVVVCCGCGGINLLVKAAHECCFHPKLNLLLLL